MEFFTEYGEASQYQIEEIIGRGSFGVVAAAVDTQTGERVAIKKIHDMFEHASDGTRILWEIKLLRLLRHPNIVEIKHILLPPARREFRDIYVVFELMESDLQKVMQVNENLTAGHHRYFLYQLLHALKYIHAANVFHRDLKPSNILVNSNCKLKICDFGLARASRDDPPLAIFWTDYVATRWYRAPELCGSFFFKTCFQCMNHSNALNVYIMFFLSEGHISAGHCSRRKMPRRQMSHTAKKRKIENKRTVNVLDYGLWLKAKAQEGVRVVARPSAPWHQASSRDGLRCIRITTTFVLTSVESYAANTAVLSNYTPAIDIWSIGCIFAEVLTRKPLFPGTNVKHQLDLITDVLGTPSHETLSQIRNEKARRYLTGMKRKHPIPFPSMFCNADPQAVRLLERLLAFDPKDRPTAEEALADPYFEGFPNLEHEPSPHPFSKLEFEFERWKLTKDGIRDLIYREILEYHPQMLQDYIRAGGQTSFVYPSGVDDMRLQFVHLEENHLRGERGIDRERVCAPKGSDNQDCNNERRRTASSAAQTTIRSQQEGLTHAYVYQNGTSIPNFCSGYYLQNGSTSASSCVIDDHEGLKENGVSEEEKVAYELSQCFARI
uniref:Uncharacterized protein n=1 Tax=Aegilops tauschii TaxID=37682 RepID=M8CLX6_AEGTA